jgi:asparagine synthase (glutamine-hydrolysing)
MVAYTVNWDQNIESTMCGIVGILSWSSDRPDEQMLRRMTNRIAHRGPDAEGLYIHDRIGLGHRRLSIIDLTNAANQPFQDPTGRYIIAFNGEIYNYQEVRAKLPDYSFLTHSDTEVLLAAFMQWGPAALHKLKGMFAFAIWDREEQSLFVCRDRLGVKPLYYFQDTDYFLFASEIRSLLESGRIPRRLDRTAMVDYLSYQSVSSPGAPIQGIRQLEAGSWMWIRNGVVEQQRYWTPGAIVPVEVASNEHEVKKTIRQLFAAAVERRLVSDVPIGAFLSGGIDSSAIVAMMAQVSSKKPVTFNLSFEESAFDESPYARLMAEKYQTEHHEIKLSQRLLLTDLDEALSQLDTPSADGINTYIVSRAIRQAGITVALSGVGGDELFAGYPFFNTIPRLLNGPMAGVKPVRSLLAGIAGILPQRNARRLAELLRVHNFNVPSLYPHFRRILTRAEVSELTRMGTVETVLEQSLLQRAEEIEKLPLLSQISVCEYLGYTQHTLLKDTDQMSMAVALEIREPFFDHDLIDYVLNVPDSIKKSVYPKSLLVESLKPLLPDEIVFRKKQGFLFPWQLWMRNELAEFCDKRIKRMAERDFINGSALINKWKRFQKGDKSVNWTTLWTFVVLEHWMEKNRVE